jgi:hypothetical protein
MATLAEILARINSASGRPTSKSPNAIAVFYSGTSKTTQAGLSIARANENAAKACASSPDFYTIYDTPAGRIAAAEEVFLPRDQRDLVWQAASARMAQDAGSQVIAFVDGADPVRTFATVELPILAQKVPPTLVNGLWANIWAPALQVLPNGSKIFDSAAAAELIKRLSSTQAQCTPEFARKALPKESQVPLPGNSNSLSVDWGVALGIVAGVAGVAAAVGIVVTAPAWGPPVLAGIAALLATTAAANANPPPPPPAGASDDIIAQYQANLRVAAAVKTAPEVAYMLVKASQDGTSGASQALAAFPVGTENLTNLKAMLLSADGPLVATLNIGGKPTTLTIESSGIAGSYTMSATDGAHVTTWNMNVDTASITAPQTRLGNGMIAQGRPTDVVAASSLNGGASYHDAVFQVGGQTVRERIFVGRLPSSVVEIIDADGSGVGGTLGSSVFSTDGRHWRYADHSAAPEPDPSIQIGIYEYTDVEGHIRVEKIANVVQPTYSDSGVPGAPQINLPRVAPISFGQLGSAFGSNL